MFDRLFEWALRQGPRILFALAALILLIGVLQAASYLVIIRGPFVAALLAWSGPMFGELRNALVGAAPPFFGAVLLHELERRRQGPAASLVAGETSSSNAMWFGTRILFLLALVFLAVGAYGLIAPLLGGPYSRAQAISLFNPAWMTQLWQGSVLLAVALGLDRVDRWLSTVRPYSG